MITFSLIPSTEIHSIIPFLQLLNDKIDETILHQRLTEMISQGYECVGIYDGDKRIGICGLWTLTKYYVGKHMEPDNVIVSPDYRGQHIGEQLMDWVHAYAKQKGCVAAELNCYVTNNAGVKFWMNQGYKILGFHFQKGL